MDLGINPYTAGLGLAQTYFDSRAKSSALRSQASTARSSAAALKGEGADAALATEFDIGQIRRAGVRSLSEIEAFFAESGVDLDNMTVDALIEAQTEIELASYMRKREGRFEESQLGIEERAASKTAKDYQKASEKTFFGGIFGF